MPARLGRALLDTFWRSDLRLVRAAIGLGSLIWAVILLIDGAQFARPAYFWLKHMAPQPIWGCAFLIVGALQFSRGVSGIPTSSGWYACIVACVSFFLWACVTTALGTALTPTPAINSGNIVIALLQGIVLVRAIARHG